MQSLDGDFNVLKEFQPKNEEELIFEFTIQLSDPEVREIRVSKKLPFAGQRKDYLFKKK